VVYRHVIKKKQGMHIQMMQKFKIFQCILLNEPKFHIPNIVRKYSFQFRVLNHHHYAKRTCVSCFIITNKSHQY